MTKVEQIRNINAQLETAQKELSLLTPSADNYYFWWNLEQDLRHDLSQLQRNEEDLKKYVDVNFKDSEFIATYNMNLEGCRSCDCMQQCISDGFCPFCVNYELMNLWEIKRNIGDPAYDSYQDVDFTPYPYNEEY